MSTFVFARESAQTNPVPAKADDAAAGPLFLTLDPALEGGDR